ncbi:histidine phosphatase family protein [Microterricola pindariensis]|uniref:phosphoglycerate mutase (2,3-diphosphoglycerate-dependent) n=1 Tax=Microterricola pindariensis TaxID=478010 RepID=A0ABX5AUV5_9MICO|nr:histidine phosphatase family protein [Microterricola pindariensis]PPL18678.1 hypothetical protein GY24_10040 [Microterricola pindariensis]
MSSRRTLRIAVAGIAAAALFSLAAISAPALAANSNSASSSAQSVKAAPGKKAEVTIYLTRHGETWLNTTHRMQGWSDSPLTESGELDARHLGAGLAEAGVKFKSAYSADMVRHYETISLALDELKYKGEPVRDKGLREVAFGKFEGETQSATFAAVTPYLTGDDMDAFLNAIVTANEGSGLTAETVDQLTARAMASLNTIAAAQAKQGGGNVLVVSSGITIVAVLDALGADTSSLTEGIDNAAVSELSYKNGAWTVVTMNDSSYVEAGAN